MADKGSGGVNFLVRTVVLTAAILIVSYLFPRIVSADSFLAAFVGAFLLGLVNAVVRPILVVLTFPITVLTLGLFLLVINALMLLLVASVVPGFAVGGFWGGVAGSVLISLVSGVLSTVIR